MLFHSQMVTELNVFTQGIEGPACDKEGNVYAVNYGRQHTIGKVTPEGICSEFIEVPDGGVGNAIRFNEAGEMFIADYVNHRILKVDMSTREITIYAEESTMHQPNDIAITSTGVLFASDPNWAASSGQMWRIDLDGKATLIETDMGTTNGIEVSPDDKYLYVNETVQRRIWKYDLSDSFEISNKRLLIEFPDFGLDGMRCDDSGNVYTTRFGKGTVAVVSPQGEVVREIGLSGENCTNLTFGGEDGRTCYVTISETGAIESFRTDIPGRCWSLWR